MLARMQTGISLSTACNMEMHAHTMSIQPPSTAQHSTVCVCVPGGFGGEFGQVFLCGVVLQHLDVCLRGCSNDIKDNVELILHGRECHDTVSGQRKTRCTREQWLAVLQPHTSNSNERSILGRMVGGRLRNNFTRTYVEFSRCGRLLHAQ